MRLWKLRIYILTSSTSKSQQLLSFILQCLHVCKHGCCRSMLHDTPSEHIRGKCWQLLLLSHPEDSQKLPLWHAAHEILLLHSSDHHWTTEYVQFQSKLRKSFMLTRTCTPRCWRNSKIGCKGFLSCQDSHYMVLYHIL